MNKQYQWSDAWLLLSIVHADMAGEANLKSIIAAGDGINPAIFNPEELESGFARLTTGGYIKEEASKFSPTRKTMRPYLKTLTPRKSVHKQLQDMEKLLDVEPNNHDELLPNPVNDLRYTGFSQAAYTKALKEYRESHRKK